MPLSSELVSQFVKITKDTKRTKVETTVYGTVVNYNGSKYVRLDGSELLTPVTMTVDAEAGERVIVRLKNHTATVTGNITSPAARVETVKVAIDSVAGVEEVIANTVTTDVLNVERARITALEADNVTINDKISANEERITDIDARLTSAQATALPTSGTALTANTLYNVSAAVGTYSFTAPATGWAHGIFITGTTPNITFTGKIIGKLPDFAANKQYEFDVYNGAWIVQEVVTQ